MNALTKYAAKKSIIKELTERISQKLYGKKPGKYTGTLSGAGFGTLLGGSAGVGIGGAIGMRNAARASLARQKAYAAAGKPGMAIIEGLGGGFLGSIGGAIAGGATGGAVGLPSGALLGSLLGKTIDKARMAKYLKARKKVNKRLALGAGGGASAAGLAALLSSKKGPKSKTASQQNANYTATRLNSGSFPAPFPSGHTVTGVEDTTSRRSIPVTQSTDVGNLLGEGSKIYDTPPKKKPGNLIIPSGRPMQIGPSYGLLASNKAKATSSPYSSKT